MRALHSTPKEGKPPRVKKEEPLQEGSMVQKGPGGKRLWNRMGDEEFVEYAKAYVRENGITSRTEASKKDSSLYFTICSRNLVEAVFEGIAPKHRTYPEDPEEFVKLARQHMQDNGICSRSELERRDSGIYAVLRKRNLIESVFEGVAPKHRTYPEDPEEMVAYARRYIQDNGICGRSELERSDRGIYAVLRTRGLLDSAFEGTSSKRRTYPEGPEALVAFAKQFIAENGITGRGELQKRCKGVYVALGRKKLLGPAFEGIARKRRAYPEDPEEFVKFARQCLLENGITGRGELSKKASGLSTAIRTRGLLERVFEGMDSKRRIYPENPEEMVAFAKQFIRENGITGRGEFGKKDPALYSALRTRELLEAVFEGIAPKHRTYPEDPEEMVAFAKKLILENGITGRVDLYRKDGALYTLLCARKLLDAVFSESEASSKAQARSAAVQGVLDELDKFGGSQ